MWSGVVYITQNAYLLITASTELRGAADIEPLVLAAHPFDAEGCVGVNSSSRERPDIGSLVWTELRGVTDTEPLVGVANSSHERPDAILDRGSGTEN